MRTAGLAVVLAVAMTAGADNTFSMDGERCSGSNFRWDGANAHVRQETIDGRGLRALKVSVENAPVSVTGGHAGGYSIEVCKAAARAADLDAIEVRLEGGELRATGPDNSRWTVAYHILAPAGADLDLSATNGPLSIRDLDGTLAARTENGPLSLRNVTGTVDGTTQNGPITLKGGSGNVQLAASNGPLTITLDGTSWQGGGLEAKTHNGPLTLKVPQGYASGVRIDSNGRGPISCRAEGCERFRAARASADSWNDTPRTIELGSGPTLVRLSAVNGPISVKDE
jgi:hypothetical protein